MPEIGLFPLGLVLVPSERVPLHIFEPRYKELVSRSIADGESFGVVLEDEAGRRDVGTLAMVAEIVHTFDDGRMNIVVEGRERFTVSEWTDGADSFPTGLVEILEDSDDSPPDAADVTAALELFRKLADVAGADVDEPEPSSDALSFAIAAHVDFGVAPKQELLEIRSERERLRRLAELLDAALDAMTREREIRERAAKNGRVSTD